MADTRIVCKTCLQPLDRVFDVPFEGAPKSEWKLVGWMHLRTPETNHEPDPITSEDAPFIDQVCDFCGEPDVHWIFPTDPNKARVLHGIKFEEEAWAACSPCHDVILTSLTGRSIARRIAPRSLPLKSVPEHLHDEFINQVLADQYQHFVEARNGEPVTLQEYVS